MKKSNGGNKMKLTILVFALAAVGLAFVFSNWPMDKVRQTLGQPPHDKLGWLDDAEYTPAMQARVAQLTRTSYADDRSWISAVQSGARSQITRDDFELFRQDRRRAIAAYPDVPQDKLIHGSWVTVDERAGVPMEFGGSNSNGTKVGDKWVLDGGTYVGIVDAAYPNRANAADTKAFFAAKREKDRAAEIKRLKESGPYWAQGGSGGSLSVHLDKKRNVVIVERAQEWASVGKRYEIPFIAEEWVGVYQMSQIEKIPSFASAVVADTKVTPSGISFGSGGNGGVIPADGTVTMGVTMPVGHK